ncbi:uncharacterized protein RCH25_037979 [Pelodytes ibericus]
MAIKKHTVGIFSRDGDVNYRWLINLLQSVLFRDVVRDVRPTFISNNAIAFRSEVSKCTFAILYHTQNRGRLNVTNVTDSLYDEELDMLNLMLGKEKVIVILDDLEDSSQDKKDKILKYQPDIRSKARELFLISVKEKESCHLNRDNPVWSEDPASLSLEREHRSMVHKRNQIREFIADQKGPDIFLKSCWRPKEECLLGS